jgi:hypothetical protein
MPQGPKQYSVIIYQTICVSVGFLQLGFFIYQTLATVLQWCRGGLLARTGHKREVPIL